MATQVPDHSAQSEPIVQEQPEAAESEVVRLRRELAEALEQQTATAEVLRVIATSPTDLTSVFRMIVDQTGRICETNLVALHLRDGDDYVLTTVLDPNAGQLPEGSRIPLGSGRAPALVIRSGTPLVSDDLLAETDERLIVIREHAAGLGYRSSAAIPLMRDNLGIGAITIMRREVRPFTDQQIALLRMFADQAVIAIENARLFQELEQQTAELQESNRQVSEALEQQTALAEVLRVIASSPTDVQRVLYAISESAARICGADSASINLIDGGHFIRAASFGSSASPVGERLPIDPDTPSGRVILSGQTLAIDDIAAVAVQEFPSRAALYLQRPARSGVCVPLRRDAVVIGTIMLRRVEVQPFAQQQIALVEAFADQAVIAIENARLFQELRDRTAELADLNHTLEARVGEQVDQLERVGRLRRYLSPQLAELIVSSGDESILASHRRRITVVFCDLRGFTAFAETEEPEEVMGVLGEYHAAMGELIRQYEGTFGHFAGDGLMIFFNDPLPQPDHVERAVRMACAMRERAADLARGWRRAGYELGFGVGVAVGYATLGRIGFEGRYDYDVIGTVANLAARLCAEAVDGQILIPARLHGMIEDLVEVETIGELTLKGLHRAVEAFNITGLQIGESLPLDRAAEPPPGDA